ncbi:hypothetical protein AB0465_37710 [Streptomyces griseoviridis]|uniref:hypothetical protein n=1 Tax=Streptomyces griseoviridis TaxID=45398 RepID=UPI00344EC9C1
MPEALWPDRAEVCVRVVWHPDPVRGSAVELRWQERVRATTATLEAEGYVVQRPGPRQLPALHPSADLLVFRLPEGVRPGPVPADGWAHLERYPDLPGRSAVEVVRDALFSAAKDSAGPVSRDYYVRALPRVLWPPHTLMCCLAGWIPRGCTDPAS